MAKRVKIPGRLESAETGNIVTGADAVMDDERGKTQVVVNNEVEAAILSLAQNKQNVLTFDNEPTEGSTNPVTSAGVYTADKALSDAIEAILLLIPSAASALNKLVDMQTMNSSIATATASFRGTYNLVSDLHLGVDATHEQIGAALDALSLGADNNDYAFVLVPNSATAPTEISKTERYKFNGTNWLFEYDLNNSGFTSQQWNAINSGVTSLLVGKLSDLPTDAELTALFAGKQDNLTFDNVPTAGSQNPVKSGGVYARNNEIVALINALDAAKQDVLTFDNAPVEGSTNPVKSGGVYTAISAVQATIVALDAAKQNVLTFDSTPTLGSTNPVTSSGIKTELNRIDGNVTTLNDLYEALTQSALVIVQPTDTWPVASPATSTIYRVVDRENTPPQYYSDYMWNGSAMVLMATYDNAIDPHPKKASQNLVTSGGVFDNMGALDVSELNATENPHTLAQYVDLSAALAAVPTDYQKGGMSIKFVQSSDNKYVQYRLMHALDNASTAADDFANIANWQGIDDEPVAGSDNLVTSGGVAERINDIVGLNFSFSNKPAFTYVQLPYVLPSGTKVKNDCSYMLYLTAGTSDSYSKVAIFAGDTVELSFDASYVRASSTANVEYKIYVDGLLDKKQDKLTFDNEPTSASNNPVTSDGIKKAINSEVGKTGIVSSQITLVENLVGYISYAGNFNPSGTLYKVYQPVKVNKGDIITLIGSASESVSIISYYNTDDNTYEPVIIGRDATSIDTYIVKCPKDGIVVFCLLNSFISQSSANISHISHLDLYTEELSVVNLYDPATATDGYRVNVYDGSLVEDGYLVSDYIPVGGVEKVTFPYDASYLGSPKLIYYNSKRERLGYIDGTSYNDLAEFTIPAEAFYIRVNVKKARNAEANIYTNACTFMCINAGHESYPSTYIKYGEENTLDVTTLHTDISDNPLYGKKVVFTGDSICNGDSDEAHMDAPIFSTIGHGWPVRIGIKNNMLWVNKGISGGTITDKNVSGGSFTISETDFGDNPDYIIMEGGTNDADRIGSILNGNVPANFGSYNIRDYNVEFDNDTFCGAVEYLFKRVLTDYPHAKKGFIIAHKMGISSHGYSADVNNRRAYFETIIALCKKWGIPYIDLWETAPMCPMLPAHYTNAVDKLYCGGTVESPDAQHPTADGFDILSPMIEAWMKTL